jgi:hypothetical protein
MGTATISSATTLPNPPLQLYFVNATGSYNITLPVPSATNKGCFVTFRRAANVAGAYPTFVVAATYAIVPPGSITAAATSYTWSASYYSIQFVSDGGSNWFAVFYN